MALVAENNVDTEKNSNGVVAVSQELLSACAKAQNSEAHLCHGEHHDTVEQVVCSRARHHEKFTDKKIFRQDLSRRA